MPIVPVVAERAEEIREICRVRGVKRLDLFGSAAGKFDEATSDADCPATFHKEVRRRWMGEYFDLQHALEDLLGRPWAWCRTARSAIPASGMRSKKAERRAMPTRTAKYLWDSREAAVAVTRFAEHDQVIGVCNVLVHGYDDVDYENIWRIVATTLPILVEDVQGLLESPTTQ